MDAPVLYSGGGYSVDGAILRTPRKTYSLRQIEYIEVRRPFLALIGLPALGVVGFCLAFWRYLYSVEIAAMLGFSLAALVFAFLFGTLRVHSLALKDDGVALNFGLVSRLREVRAAVERAMASGPMRRDDT